MKKYLYPVILVIISFIPLIDMFHPGLPLTHDGQDHVARIANFYQSLSEGNIVPRWAGNLNWGYGHPILMFLYPLPSYLASLFHFIGFSLVDSTKIVFGFSFVISAYLMYLWVKEISNKESAFLSGILYAFAPYRFIDLYVRGAIGEHVAFIFPPLICYFLVKFTKTFNPAFGLGISLSIAGLLLSHNAISIMFLPFIFIYSLHLLIHNKQWKNLLIHYCFTILMGVLLSSFFLIPAFFEGKYTLRDIVTKADYSLRFVKFSNLFFGKWSFGGSGSFSVQIGLIHWLIIILSTLYIVLYLIKKKQVFNSIIWYVCFWISIFFMVPNSLTIWNKILILQKFQFPWRFLSLSVFSSAYLGGFVLSAISKRYKMFVLSLLVILILLVSKDYWQAKDFLYKNDYFYKAVYEGTTDTGESAPIWSVRFMEKKPKANIEVIKGNAIVNEIKRSTTVHAYKVNTSENIRVRENTLFFPGWNVYIDSKHTDIQFQDPANRGLITFFVPYGYHTIDVIFSETKLRLLADNISIFSIIALGMYWFFSSKNIWKRFQ